MQGPHDGLYQSKLKSSQLLQNCIKNYH